jgi:hypothetical protein
MHHFGAMPSSVQRNRHGPVSDSQANAGVLTTILANLAEPLATHEKRVYIFGLAYIGHDVVFNALLD